MFSYYTHINEHICSGRLVDAGCNLVRLVPFSLNLLKGVWLKDHICWWAF